MMGRISLSGDKFRRLSAVREHILELPLLLVELPPDPRPRHLRRAGRLLSRQGVRRVLAPEGFGGWETLARYGLEPVEPGDLCRALAAPIALAALARAGVAPDRATVVLRGERVTRSFRLAALALCPQVRNLLVSAPAGGPALQAELRREYGVPALEDRPGRGADLAVCFSAAEGGAERILDLSGPRPGLGEFSFVWADRALPGDVDRLELLCALWETGRLTADQISVFAGGHLDSGG